MRRASETHDVKPGRGREFCHNCGFPAAGRGGARHIVCILSLNAEASSLVAGSRNVRRIILESLFNRTFIIVVFSHLHPAASCNARNFSSPDRTVLTSKLEARPANVEASFKPHCWHMPSPISGSPLVEGSAGLLRKQQAKSATAKGSITFVTLGFLQASIT